MFWSLGDRRGVVVDFGVSLIIGTFFVVSTSCSGALSTSCIVSIGVFFRVFSLVNVRFVADVVRCGGII